MENSIAYRLPASDIGFSFQYWDVVTRKGYTQPEKYLMLAVLKDAILDYINNFESQNRLFQNAQTWFFEESSDQLFSFESICDMLNLNPNGIRKDLLTKKQVRSGRS